MQPTVMNRIEDDEVYKSTYPTMTGSGASGATHEIHIFLNELNPPPDRVQEYYKVTKAWNESHPECAQLPMKPCYLALVFRDPDGNDKTVSVMQSARYMRSNDQDEVVGQCHQDAQWFVDHGFSVVREKIEATAYGIIGIPQNALEAEKFPSKYFEFHIKVQKTGAGEFEEIGDEEIAELKKISDEFTKKLGTPVPLSYNLNRDKLKGDGQGSQRFLNVRFRGVGMGEIKPRLEEIKSAIESTCFKVVKIISEYVWYDSFTQLDHGWIDFTEEEMSKLIKS